MTLVNRYPPPRPPRHKERASDDDYFHLRPTSLVVDYAAVDLFGMLSSAVIETLSKCFVWFLSVLCPAFAFSALTVGRQEEHPGCKH